MASEFEPLSSVLRELNALLARKESGTLFIVTGDSHASMIRLREGRVEEVSFSNRHGDEAVLMLAQAGTARARFQPSSSGALPPSKRPPLGDAARQWLLGGYAQAAGTEKASSASSIPVAQAQGEAVSQSQRATVERVALVYLGPIAGLICEEAFADDANIDLAIERLAANLPEREEADRFMAEVRGALAKG